MPSNNPAKTALGGYERANSRAEEAKRNMRSAVAGLENPNMKVDPEASMRLHNILQELQEVDEAIRNSLRRREVLVKQAHECEDHMKALGHQFRNQMDFVDDSPAPPRHAEEYEGNV